MDLAVFLQDRFLVLLVLFIENIDSHSHLLLGIQLIFFVKLFQFIRLSLSFCVFLDNMPLILRN